MKCLTFFLFCFVFLGCATPSFYLTRNYERDQVLTTSVGNTMTSEKLEHEGLIPGLVVITETELIYSGKAGNIIKIAYREYSEGYARPAFSQEAQYDLSESKVIKFKNITLEIIQATNQGITYKVLDSPGLKYPQGKLSNKDADSIRQKE